VAAALQYLNTERKKSSLTSTAAAAGRWKLSGRHAALNARQSLSDQVSSKWRKL